MNLDEILPYPGFRINHISCPEAGTVIRVHLERLKDQAPLCYKCGQVLSKIKTHQKCTASDLGILERKTTVSFRRLKGKCPQCKCYRQERIDWLSPENPKMTARLGILLFKLCEVAPVSRIARITERSAMTMWRNDLSYLQAQLSRYAIPSVTQISVDEVYARAWHDKDENRNDRFFTIISDLKSHRVIWVEQSRSKDALDRFFEKIGPEACLKITVVSTDQHDDYKRSVEQHCPNATHVYDRFHLVKKFEEAVNETRKMLYKMLPQKNIRELARPKYRFIFLKRDDYRSESEKAHMAKIMKDNEAFVSLELIKERYITFFDSQTEGEALAVFNEMGVMIHAAGFPPLKEWWQRTRKEWKTILNYFRYRVTTALSEGINNVIKSVKRRAFGFRNMEYFRLKIMQVCGFLSLDYLNPDGTWTQKAKVALGITKSLENLPM